MCDRSRLDAEHIHLTLSSSQALQICERRCRTQQARRIRAIYLYPFLLAVAYLTASTDMSPSAPAFVTYRRHDGQAAHRASRCCAEPLTFAVCRDVEE
eukprot:scaffold434250_cov20-Prasinocladus_malaysianus.AAC.1